MSFFTKVASGGLLAAGVTYYYHIDIRETSQLIGRDLHRLSEQLLASIPVSPNSPAENDRNTFPQPAPSRVGIKESIKARVCCASTEMTSTPLQVLISSTGNPDRQWNEKIEAGVIALRETEWSSVISKTWNHAKYGAVTLKDKMAPAAEEVKEVTDRRQV
ncbi:BQ2448_2287 [Microbotryum intermedium]|uniref:BQ2448_2287 protein n=1 Tax=Microbotryum intermedium TaxID=269621 RepID=A0A238F7Z1_9BASI|nr:BQ2448_2287 [Microbotryum intermedium]